MSKIALVTGGNKGLGYAICKGLAKHNNALTILLGSRDLQRGEEARRNLANEGVTVHPLQIDITNKHSVQSAAAKIKEEYGGLDILIHNAGIATKGDQFDEEVCRKTIDTNYYGTLNAHQTLAPLLRENCRVVFVSSASGRQALNNMSKKNRDRFFEDSVTIDKLSEIIEEFITDVKNNQWESKGWPNSAYGMSKAAVTALTRILARENKLKGAAINCCCPGLTDTDMTGGKGHPADVGAQIAIKCASLPVSDNPQTGLFWKDQGPQPFHN